MSVRNGLAQKCAEKYTRRLRLATDGYNSRVRTVTGGLTTEEFGEALVENGMITAEQRDWAMRAREQAGTSLSVILISSGLIRRLDLFRVLAEESPGIFAG